MPYILASQHPVIHAACFCTTLIIIFTFGTDLRSGWGCEEPIKSALITLSVNNLLCIFLQFIITYLNNRMFEQYKFTEMKQNTSEYNFSYFNQLLILTKVLSNFMSICFAQYVILNYFDTDNPERCDIEKSTHKHEIVWIFYQIMLFYLNIAS